MQGPHSCLRTLINSSPVYNEIEEDLGVSTGVGGASDEESETDCNMCFVINNPAPSDFDVPA